MAPKPYWYIVFFLGFTTIALVFLYDFPKESGSEKDVRDVIPSPAEQPVVVLSDRDKLLLTMKETFSDEFDKFIPYVDQNGNTTCSSGGVGIWQTVYHFCSRTNSANAEAEVYSDANFLSHLKGISKEEALSDPEYPFELGAGTLKIKAWPSSDIVKQKVGAWAKYTSGMITTQFSFTQTYGYFEIRAKLPKGKGVWPAFWLLPADKSWPPEVDVFESFGEKNEKGYGGHYKIHRASHSNKKDESCGEWWDAGIDLTEGFHTYGANVQPEGISFYFDGSLYATCKPNFETNKPFYMVANVAIGGPGSWPGEPGPNNPWPAILEIDYIKAFRKK